DRPGIWVRPKRLDHFTVAHELTHLLQARGLVPRGERACDLWAVARSPLIVDHAPGYLRLPSRLRRDRLDPAEAQSLCDLARQAIAAREAGDRRYLARFEREAARIHGDSAAIGRNLTGARRDPANTPHHPAHAPRDSRPARGILARLARLAGF